MERLVSVDYVEELCKKHNIDCEVGLKAGYDKPHIVLDLENPEDDVGHYVCTFMLNGKRHYFDPYGKENSKISYDTRNKIPFQSMSANTCARWCVYRLKHKNLNDTDFIKVLSHPWDLHVLMNV